MRELRDAVTVMNKQFQRLLIISDFHCDGLACLIPGMPGKKVGVAAVISVAAVAAGCYFMFKVSVKLAWSPVQLLF